MGRPSEPEPDRTRIVYVMNDLRIGGSERQLLRVVERLDRVQRWSVSVYCLQRTGEYIHAMEELGVEVVGPTNPLIASPRHVLRSLVRLYSYLRRVRPVIAHCYLDMAGCVGSMAAQLAGVPYVITTRRGACVLRGKALIRRRVIAGVTDRCSNVVIAVSKAAREQAIREGTPAAKIVTVYNSVPLPEHAAARRQIFDGSPVLGSVGSLLAYKGHRFLVEAAPLVLADLPEACFVLVGDGPERFRLERLVAELGVGERVHFLGQRTDVAELLPEFDVFVLPSLTEGMPNAILEAMAAGIAVVATRVGGVPEIMQDGATGLLVEPESPPDLARALIDLGRDAPMRLALAQRARDVVASRFSPQREIDETEAVYLQLVRQRPRSRTTRSPMESG